MSRPIEPLPLAAGRELIARALAEDLGSGGDRTTRAVVDPESVASGRVVARSGGAICGLSLLSQVFQQVDPAVEVELRATDGARVPAGSDLARVSGRAASLLTGERTALNLLGWLSGIATATRDLVDRVAGTGAAILDTRKTTPTLRIFERYAVRCGGGENHRFGLDDMILIKDNHVVAAGSVGEAVRRARAAASGLLIEAEVTRLDQIEEAIVAGADLLLLDNLTLHELHRAVEIVARRVPLEASGGVTAASVRAIAETGVDRISVGWITHSAPALDVALDFYDGAPTAPGGARAADPVDRIES